MTEIRSTKQVLAFDLCYKAPNWAHFLVGLNGGHTRRQVFVNPKSYDYIAGSFWNTARESPQPAVLLKLTECRY